MLITAIIIVFVLLFLLWPKKIPDSETIFLDTETTGLAKGNNEILEVAIVDHEGNTLIDTLVKPEKRKRWPQAQEIHGISPADVEDRPTLTELMPRINDIITGKRLVIYNAKFDTWFFPNNLVRAGKIECAMLAYQKKMGFKKYSKLSAAARAATHKWTGEKHRALSDALACRSVWLYIQS